MELGNISALLEEMYSYGLLGGAASVLTEASNTIGISPDPLKTGALHTAGHLISTDAQDLYSTAPYNNNPNNNKPSLIPVNDYSIDSAIRLLRLYNIESNDKMRDTKQHVIFIAGLIDLLGNMIDINGGSNLQRKVYDDQTDQDHLYGSKNYRIGGTSMYISSPESNAYGRNSEKPNCKVYWRISNHYPDLTKSFNTHIPSIIAPFGSKISKKYEIDLPNEEKSPSKLSEWLVSITILGDRMNNVDNRELPIPKPKNGHPERLPNINEAVGIDKHNVQPGFEISHKTIKNNKSPVSYLSMTLNLFADRSFINISNAFADIIKWHSRPNPSDGYPKSLSALVDFFKENGVPLDKYYSFGTVYIANALIDWLKPLAETIVRIETNKHHYIDIQELRDDIELGINEYTPTESMRLLHCENMTLLTNAILNGTDEWKDKEPSLKNPDYIQGIGDEISCETMNNHAAKQLICPMCMLIPDDNRFKTILRRKTEQNQSMNDIIATLPLLLLSYFDPKITKSAHLGPDGFKAMPYLYDYIEQHAPDLLKQKNIIQNLDTALTSYLTTSGLFIQLINSTLAGNTNCADLSDLSAILKRIAFLIKRIPVLINHPKGEVVLADEVKTCATNTELFDEYMTSEVDLDSTEAVDMLRSSFPKSYKCIVNETRKFFMSNSETVYRMLVRHARRTGFDSEQVSTVVGKLKKSMPDTGIAKRHIDRMTTDASEPLSKMAQSKIDEYMAHGQLARAIASVNLVFKQPCAGKDAQMKRIKDYADHPQHMLDAFVGAKIPGVHRIPANSDERLDNMMDIVANVVAYDKQFGGLTAGIKDELNRLFGIGNQSAFRDTLRTLRKIMSANNKPTLEKFLNIMGITL